MRTYVSGRALTNSLPSSYDWPWPGKLFSFQNYYLNFRMMAPIDVDSFNDDLTHHPQYWRSKYADKSLLTVFLLSHICSFLPSGLMACVLHQLNDFQGERNLLKLSVLYKMSLVWWERWRVLNVGFIWLIADNEAFVWLLLFLGTYFFKLIFGWRKFESFLLQDCEDEFRGFHHHRYS